MIARAKELEANIKRHCDVESAYMTFKQLAICSFCGNEWEIREDGYPDCCQQAQDEHELQQKQLAEEPA